MNERANVYVEPTFWSSWRPSTEDGEDFLRWFKIKSLCESSNIFINMTAKQFDSERQSNDILSQIWRRSCDANCGLEFSDPPSENLKQYFKRKRKKGKEEFNQSLFSLYLTNTPSETIHDIQKKYGVLICNLPDRKEWKCTSDTKSLPLEKNESFKWERLREFITESNSLILTDNYLFKEETYIRNNFLPLMETILPCNCEPSYHITIFSKDLFCYISKEQRLLKDSELCEYIKKEIEKIRPQLAFTLSMYKCDKEFHDRTLITNNYIITVGGGFDLLYYDKIQKETKTQKETDITIEYPLH